MPTHLIGPWLTPQNVADELLVDYRTVWLEIHRKRLRANKVGAQWRISRANLDAYLRQNASA